MKHRFVYLCLLAIFALTVTQAARAAQHVSATESLDTTALQPGQTAVIAVVVNVDKGYHIQSHTPLDEHLIKFDISTDSNANIEFLEPVYPPPTIHNSTALGKESLYYGKVIVYIPLRVKSSATPGPIVLRGNIIWQACSEIQCLRPEKKSLNLSTNIVPVTAAVKPADSDLFTGFDSSIFARNATPIATNAPATSSTIEFFGHSFSLASSDYGLALLVALAVGVLFNLMPCVLPVVPLKAIGFFEVSKHNRIKCFALGLVFSAGIIAIFAVLATILIPLHARLHFNWGEQFKYPLFVWSIVAVLSIFSLGMFGLFEVGLPDAINNLTPRHDTYGGNFLFGMLTAVLSTPCTAPMLPALIAWALLVPTTVGVAAIIVVGVGMALPYLILSAFPAISALGSRTGAWSAVLKQEMGFAVLAVAVYFAGGQLFSKQIFFWFVFAVVIAAMVFLIVRTIQLTPRVRPIVISTVFAIAMSVVALIITQRMVGGLDWQKYSPEALAQAKQSGRPVMMEFTANWCGNCIALEATVFHDKRVASILHQNNVILMRADLTKSDAPGWDLVNQLNPGGGIPLTAIYSPKTPDQSPITLTSLYTSNNLIDAIDRASSAK